MTTTCNKPRFFLLLAVLSLAASACGEIDESDPPSDYEVPAATSAPSLLDPAAPPASDLTPPAMPDGPLPPLPGEPPAPLPDPGPASASVVSPAPADPSLAIAPLKDPDLIRQERIRGQQPPATTAPPAPGPELTPPEPPACPRDCQQGTTLDLSSCQCK